ncbi:hypothetical protein BV22DRAFT_1031745 [Leucogyrophana mollusca]|uniref:Uncharacterized protein n=1 Tax=Leucogyrophana mollusca TaxID=85980 RepID=A0ACB8BQ92_9AGAM|nr:hypothetical protein BV22DRAFT_1031745 [Leucogyrophana mollusca]
MALMAGGWFRTPAKSGFCRFSNPTERTYRGRGTRPLRRRQTRNPAPSGRLGWRRSDSLALLVYPSLSPSSPFLRHPYTLLSKAYVSSCCMLISDTGLRHSKFVGILTYFSLRLFARGGKRTPVRYLYLKTHAYRSLFNLWVEAVEARPAIETCPIRGETWHGWDILPSHGRAHDASA